MATETQRDDFRVDLGDTGDGFTDPEIDRLFARAEAVYSDAALIYAYAKVLGARQLYAQAIKRVTYKQGDSTENLSDIAKGLKQLEQMYQGELDDLVNSKSSPVKLMGMKTKTRSKSVPGY